MGKGSYATSGGLSTVLDTAVPVTTVLQPPGVKTKLVGDKLPNSARR